MKFPTYLLIQRGVFRENSINMCEDGVKNVASNHQAGLEAPWLAFLIRQYEVCQDRPWPCDVLNSSSR